MGIHHRSMFVACSVASAVAVAALLSTGCTDVRDVGIDNLPTTTAVESYEALAKRLEAVSTDEIVMDAAFNRDLIAVGLRTIGFDDAEAGCTVDAIAAARPGGMNGTVAELFDASSMSPAVMASCIDPTRLAAIGAPTPVAELPPEVTEEFQRLASALAAAGFETVGLTAKEASCLGAASGTSAAISAVNDGAALSPLGAPVSVDPAHARSCVTPDRLAQLLR